MFAERSFRYVSKTKQLRFIKYINLKNVNHTQKGSLRVMHLRPNVNILTDATRQGRIQIPVKHLTWCFLRK